LNLVEVVRAELDLAVEDVEEAQKTFAVRLWLSIISIDLLNFYQD